MHFFILPTTNCNSHCSYCYNKNNVDAAMMTKEVVKDAILFIDKLLKEKPKTKVHITFHGGEPLLTGSEFYSFAIPYIAETLGKEAHIGIQSNLWKLDENLCQLFKQYHVSVGTSLDGPIAINDLQRGAGYNNKTTAGIELLNKNGMSVGCIATFTKPSSLKLQEIVDYFISKGLHFDVHGAVKPFDHHENEAFYLSPEEFGTMLINLLELYLKNLTRIRIGTLNTLIKNVSNQKSGLCTFTKCLGNYFAISPSGDLYTCNRFVGNPDFCIGNIRDIHSFTDITNSEAYKKQQAWQDWIDKECGECLFKEFCNGGCPYSAFAAGNGEFVKDPHCEAYKMIYSYIIDKGTEEFFSDSNLDSLGQPEGRKNEPGFLDSPILYLMKDNPHPFDVVNVSKKIITAAFLGETSNSKKASEKLADLGILNSIEKQLPIIDSLYSGLLKPAEGYNNLYLHITDHCNLACSHCYVYNEKDIKRTHISYEIITQLLEDLNVFKFNKLIIIGGEPLLHPDFEALLDKLLILKNNRKLPVLVLRTNLTNPQLPDTIEKIKRVFDQIVVSIDGPEQMHDRQRGTGNYMRTLANLALFDPKTIEKKVSIACVLNTQSLSESEVEAAKNQVMAIKSQYPVKDIRFLPMLPLGRAKNIKIPTLKSDAIGVMEWMSRKKNLRTSCGLGQSLMIESNGDAYPCHVVKETDNEIIGNLYNQRLHEILEKPSYARLRNINVNNIHKCSSCSMRYLCGGVCKIWENEDCTDLYSNAEYLLNDALHIWNRSKEATL